MTKDIIRTDTIWYKITDFFKRNFLKKKNDNLNNTYTNEDKFKKVNEEMVFKNRINVRDEEKERVLKLQLQLRNKQITEDELSKEDINKILELYEQQIVDLKNQIENNKAILKKLKKETD